MKIRKASNNDGQFILELIVRNSKDHFSPIWVIPEYQKPLIEQMQRTINAGACPMPDGVYPSSIHVLVIEERSVGFLWLLHRSEGVAEIYIMAIAPEHRRKGYAESLINNTLSTLEKGSTATSRVKRKSRAMKDLLRKLGFQAKFALPFKVQHFFRAIS
ncbi:GNAT family N-acetyltransferase [Balneatrix alpica]|uniref:GNAT family N-acetyltransferase n=1 Tax=Balneatrix alpica TaxID=75684 RepID=A0ABV5ZCB3_9GAMM|nr:GNAT family N-acetyltransferase [Balneatrix alpica]